MRLTIEQFKNQNKFWEDNFYWYAIHKTDGGAEYLYQVDKKDIKGKMKDDFVTPFIIRLDGSFLINFIKEV